MISGGVAISLASDFNPGSCPVNSLQVVMGIACRQMKLRPAEAISAVTINAAHPRCGGLLPATGKFRPETGA
jgi:imidazolonepropionase